MSRLTIEQLEGIREGIEKGTPQRAITKEVGVSLSAVNRVNNKLLKTGKFDDHIAALKAHAKSPTNGNGKGGKRKHRGPTADAKLVANIRHLKAQGLSGREIAERLNIGQSMVFYWANPKRKQKDEPRKFHDTTKMATRAVAMQQKGWTREEIAEKLGVVKSTVGYYLDKKAKELQIIKEPSTNGTGPSAAAAAINKNVCVGIAYAEVERFIGVLSQRLGLTPEVLRSRLSELLGHSPLRANSGVAD